ncbi:hypothetical protein QCA50_006433 [Cerrena zonata]|uniref:F-box domain-containing protein n=1 Tax=Cerrena zonata TaxID=2478898 RepID=A0AAW0GER3_9APHY
MNPVLPQELSNIIVDHLDDRPTLTSCALVNKAWLHHARFHIFFRVVARYNMHKPELIRRSESEYGFLTDIISLGEDITNLVREVHLTASLIYPAAPLFESLVATLLRSFPKLTSLVLEQVEFKFTEPTISFDPPPLPNSLRRLTLHKCSSTPDQLITLLESIPYLEDLRLLDHHLHKKGHTTPATQVASTISRHSLTSLCLDGMAWPRFFIGGLEPSPSRLKNFNVTIYALAFWGLADEFIYSSAGSIHHLHFIIEHLPPDDPCDFIITQSVRSISLRIFASICTWSMANPLPFFDWKRRALSQFGLVLRILRRLPSTFVTHFEVQIVYSDSDPADLLADFQWHTFDMTLKGLVKLEGITFSGSITRTDSNSTNDLEHSIRVPLPDQWKAFLRAKLPLSSRILGFK